MGATERPQGMHLDGAKIAGPSPGWMLRPRGRSSAEFDKFSAPLGRQQHRAEIRVVAGFHGAEGAEAEKGTVPNIG